MSTTYAGTDVFPITITLPADGDPPVVASVNVPLEGLADRTAYLKSVTDSMDGVAYRNFQTPIINDTTSTPLDFSSARGDGTSSSPAFWSSLYNLWFKPGSPTAGSFYIGDNGYISKYACGATSPPTLQIGCDSTIGTTPGRVALFHALSVSANPSYVLGPATGDFNGTWVTRVWDSNTYGSFVRANDCVVTPSQSVILVGGGDASGFGQLIVWRSVDFGFSFTRILVANSPSFGQYFSRVVGSYFGRLVTWQTANTAVGGNVLYYSDNDGATWSSRSGIGFDNIVDGAYLPDLDIWAFVSGTSIWTTPDPVLGAFTQWPIGIAASALGGVGHALLYAQQISGIRPELRLSLDGMNTANFVYREIASGGSDSLHSISASPLGQLCAATTSSLVFTEKP